VVGVDPDEKGVEADRPLEERHERAERTRRDLLDRDRHRAASLLGQRLARPEEEAVEIVARGDVLLDGERGEAFAPVFQDLDERREEVRDPLAELLDERVLIGRSLVPVDGDPLVDRVPREVLLLPERLHDELLEVAGEEEEPVLVRKDDHVLQAAPPRLAIPRERQEGGRVPPDVGDPGRRVAGARPLEQAVDVEALERRREEADGRELRGPPADPVPHGEAVEPALPPGELVEVAPLLGHGHGVPAEVEPLGRVGRLDDEHAVARLLRPARLGDDDDERPPDPAGRGDPVELPGHAVGVGVVEEERAEGVRGAAERVGDELRSERRPADPDEEDVLEPPARLGRDLPGVDVCRERLHTGDHRLDRPLHLGARGELGGAEPVVPDPSPLVGIRDGPRLERGHRRERGRERLEQERVARLRVRGEARPRDVDQERDGGDVGGKAPETGERFGQLSPRAGRDAILVD